MDNYITLLGAEDVKNAGHNMQRAASEMSQAANYIWESLERNQQRMDEWLTRFEAALKEAKQE